MPEDEARKMLGENGIRFFGLDRDRLAAIAKRIGPTIDEIVNGPEISQEMLDRFTKTSGYLKPYEGEEKIDDIDKVLVEDLAVLGATL